VLIVLTIIYLALKRTGLPGPKARG